MNIKNKVAIALVSAMILAVLFFSASLPNRVGLADGRLDPTIPVQVQNDVQLTATPVVFQELQVPWTPVNFTPVVSQEIPWDHLKLIGNWTAAPGLAPGVDVFYLQSGTPNTIVLPGLPFVVPSNEHLVFGGFNGTLSIRNTDGTTSNYSYTNGFYAALPSGTNVTELTVTDGFALLVVDSNAKNEFCYRVAQAYAEQWAHDHIFHSPAWTAPVCDGVYSVPLDNDR